MQFGRSGFDVDNPDSWLILSIFIGFWVCSYYSLVMCLIHTRKQNRLLENEEESLEVTS